MPNQLSQETSPYLLQHAANPVDWHPWGEEALGRAKSEDKPILLSIGYSACHWCHVMAHESFEDPAVAEVMNRLFVNIKVDREERPDLDQIYQLAHQMLARRPGGWPLTMFLLPDGTPFYGGTYFPKAARYNLPGFPELCERVAAIYRERRADIATQSRELRSAFESLEPRRPGAEPALDAQPIAAAVQSLKGSLDPEWGGFGGAPKFPHCAELELCLRRYAANGDADAARAAVLTLTRMAQGGIFDHVGGGFARYSVDAEWTIPHFEKMLYDNGPLLGLYADAWTLTGEPLFRAACEQTAEWLLRDMRAPEGGFYSSLDADSEHEEGKFYVWTPDEVRALLTPDEYALAAPHFGLDGPPNFENAHWHLRVVKPLQAVAQSLGLSEVQAEERLAALRAKLFAARKRRIHPGRDEKILTSWNALAIRGLARAGLVFDRSDWVDAAHAALQFIRTTMWRDGRLLATAKDGRAHLDAYLDDHAFLVAACIELLQARFSTEVLAFGRELADALLARFEDPAEGGFFFTGRDHEQLFHRGKPGHDNATPSGNGVAGLALQHLGFLTGHGAYADAAGRALTLFQPQFQERPTGFASLLMALEEWLTPTRTVILRGPAVELAGWRRTLAQRYRPATLVLGLEAAGLEPGARGLPHVLDKPARAGGVNAWVCEGVTCLAPVTDLPALLALLDGDAPET
jgi:uncharacterized protein YyaL (SSP411 family)